MSSLRLKEGLLDKSNKKKVKYEELDLNEYKDDDYKNENNDEDHEHDNNHNVYYQINNDDNEENDDKPIKVIGNLGGFAEAVLEELSDDQDNLENFLTTMFLLGVLLIPLLLIFSEYIKPYDRSVIIYIQNTSLYKGELFRMISKITNMVYTLKFHTSFCVFLYLAIDPGVAFKVASTAGLTTYLGFYLEALIHDSRPYWVSADIKPAFCHVNFGCPSINILSGFLYYNLLYFNLNRAINAKDPFTSKNKLWLQIGSFLSLVLIVFNYLLGIELICNGENYIYQIAVTYFFGFVIIRILITFNKEIDYIINGTRYILHISNYMIIWVFLYILSLACLSWVIYSIIHPTLLIPKEYIQNINHQCPGMINQEVTIQKTLLDTCVMFQIVGIAFGINFVLKNVKNPYYWQITSWFTRLLRGIIGFSIHYMIILFIITIELDFITQYAVMSLLSFFAALTCHGFLPYIFDKLSLLNQDMNEEIKRKYLIYKKELR